MNLFDVTTLPFEMSAGASTTYHVVREPLFESYSSLVGQLRKLIGDEDLDTQWAEVNRGFRRYRYDASRVPLPFSHPFFVSRIDFTVLQEIVGLGEYTRPELASTATQCLALLVELAGSDRNPMGEAIGQFLAPEDSNYTIALILAHSRYLPPVRSYYNELGFEALEVLDQNTLRRAAYWNRLAVVGSIADFDDFVFSAPRAPETEVIGYPWHQDRWSHTNAFLGGRSGKSSHRQRVSESSHSQMDTLSNVDLRAIQDHLLESQSIVDGVALPSNVQIEARLHELFGGKAVFLEVSDRRATMIIDLDAEKDVRARQATDSEIEEGMYVVLRTDSQAGYIVPIADRLIGVQADAFRTLQAKWKSRLRLELERVETKGLAELLSTNGSSRANYQNIQNWISPRSIAPESDDDFRAIACVCGLDSQFEEMKRVAKKLRAAHMLAGQRVRRQLRELVKEADAVTIDRKGYEQFELPELPGAQLTAFRIERRSTKVTPVAASAIERVFDFDVF